MKIRKILAFFVTFAMALSCLGVAVFAEEAETIALGEIKTISVPAADEVDEYVSFAFTPEVSDTYSFCVDGSFEEDQSAWLTVELDGTDVSFLSGDGYVCFDAQADETYDLIINYWGEYHSDAEYTLWVEQWRMQELYEGENDLTVPYEGLFFSFTPAQTGYYLFAVEDADMIDVTVMDAELVSDGTDSYYYLEADQAYTGSVFSYMEDAVDTVLSITYFADVEAVVPVSMEISNLPANTVYLSSCLTDESQYGVDLSGLEMKITWSDGAVTDWSYNDDGFWVEDYSIRLNLYGTGTVEVSIDDVDVEPVCFELTVLDITAESIAPVDGSPLKVVENSCGLDLSLIVEFMEGWYYLPMQAYTREVVITFSDGSTVNAMPGESVYGLPIEVADNQMGDLMSEDDLFGGFWTKDGDNYVTFCYENVYADLAVEIVDSPVASIELVTPPKNNTIKLDDEFGMVNADGETVGTIRDLFEGMSLKVTLLDGSSRTFGAEEIQWVTIDGEEIPFVDGYPVGVFGGLMGMLWQEFEVPCDLEIVIEYMGAETSYTLSVVEEFEEVEDPENPDTPDIPDTPENPDDPEPNPETGDMSLLVPMTVMITAMLAAVIVSKKKYF